MYTTAILGMPSLGRYAHTARFPHNNSSQEITMEFLLVQGHRGPEVAKLRQALAIQLGADAADFGDLASGDVLDDTVQAAVRRWQAGVGLIADGVMGPRSLEVLGLRHPPAMGLPLSLDTVRQLFPATKPANVGRYLPYVAAALGAVGLVDAPMICAALGTIRAESEGFLPISEFPSQFNTKPGGAPFSAYDGRVQSLGNSQPGDGARFKGRGFVQLTGRFNYDKYGQALGVDLTVYPDLANAPEIASLLLAQFLLDKAVDMRSALRAGDLAKARKLVNGGSHGLDRFKDVFRLSKVVWPPAPVGKSSGKKAAAPKAAAPTRQLNARKDPRDLRDRPYLPPAVSLLPEFPPHEHIHRFLPAYSKAGLILDQGTEGACTGFGLACVVNHMRWRKADFPKTMHSVSPRMLYNFARRYDEYAGEDYDGSSCRGALKGLYNHGVCLEDDWPYEDPSAQPKYGYAARATQTTLGVYFRVDLTSITDLQAAIQEVGAVYVSAFTHDGWGKVGSRSKPPARHADVPVIAFNGKPSEVDGHAFALVGFNTQGFIIQNSWGTGWGMGGFAVLTYADWLANAMDAWVVTLGVPGVVVGRVSSAVERASKAGGGANQSLWWSEDQAYQHSLVFGNDGRMKRYLTEDELSRTLLHQVAGLPDQWFRTQNNSPRKKLVIYAHGGLNDEAAAITRARAMGRHFIGNDCYPLFLVWKTGMLESIGNIISDASRGEPQRAGFGEAITERTDLLLEKTVGRGLARPIWSEMKENAELAYGSGRGGDLLVTALQRLHDSWGDALEIHLIGHSAGAIMLGHLLTSLATRQVLGNVASVHLYAPACTVQFANRHYALHAEVMQKLHIHILSDRVERDDSVGGIYRKSLLYFVSNALEVDLRTPILGLHNVFNTNYGGWDGTSSTGEALRAWREAVKEGGLLKDQRLNVIDTDDVLTALPSRTVSASHGGFDNDISVMTQTLKTVLGGPLLQAVDDLRGF
ncbi:MAG: hypothetical protein RIS44_789 [Pseudomonadota bacterium]|jgi:hypothetical protein